MLGAGAAVCEQPATSAANAIPQRMLDANLSILFLALIIFVLHCGPRHVGHCRLMFPNKSMFANSNGIRPWSYTRPMRRPLTSVATAGLKANALEIRFNP